MDFRYLTPIVYPSRFANRLQVIKMSEAFSGYCRTFILYVRDIRVDLKKIFSQYNVSRAFNIKALGSSFGFPRSFFFAFRAQKLIFLEPDAVWFMRDGLLAYWLTFLTDLKNKNFFFEAHSFERLPKFIYRRVFNFSRGIITTNNNKAKDIEKFFGVPKEKIFVALNGVDINIFSNLLPPRTARFRLKLPDDKNLAVYTGTPSRDKGINVLLEAAGLLPENIRIISVGGSKNDIEMLKNEKNFDKIHWIPQVSHDKIPDYLAAADILVAPFSGKNSWTTLYTSPLKIPEYLASGKAIVISDLPSVREFVSDNEVFFFKADDAADLAQTIEGVLKNSEIMLQKGNRAKIKARDYSWHRRAKTIIEFIEKYKK